MKVAIEASILTRDFKTGTYHYLHNLLAPLSTRGGGNTYSLFYFRPRHTLELGAATGKFKSHIIWWFPRRLYNLLLRTPFAPPIDLLAGIRADVFLFPAFVRWPLLRGKKSIVIIYDLSFITSQKTQLSWFNWYLNRAVPKSVKKATKVITISKNSQREIIENLGVDPKKISVITPAVDHGVYQPATGSQIAKIKQKYGIKDKYILFLGTLEPRKNVARIIKAYSLLPTKLRGGYQLVLAGGKGWLDEEILDLIDQQPSGQVVKTDYVAEADVPALYSGGSVFVYPSLYEGWGMQVLEAMACGVPVVTANNSSLPEVAGDAAILVEATDALAISKAVSGIISDSSLATAMRAKGIAHAKKFTWEDSAEKLKTVIEQAGKQ